MTAQEWFDRFAAALAALPEPERERAEAYYRELYSDKKEMGMSEGSILLSFGSPENAAAEILNNFTEDGGDERNGQTADSMPENNPLCSEENAERKDGILNMPRGKVIAAVVASEKFAEEVGYLAGFAQTVHAFCLYPDASFGAENVVVHMQKPVAVEGRMRVERLVLADGTLDVSAVFFLRDAAPPAALVGGLETDGTRVKVGRNLSTNLPGLFAAGDVTGRPYQYVKAAGEGCTAAYSAHAYLAEKSR